MDLADHEIDSKDGRKTRVAIRNAAARRLRAGGPHWLALKIGHGHFLAVQAADPFTSIEPDLRPVRPPMRVMPSMLRRSLPEDFERKPPHRCE